MLRESALVVGLVLFGAACEPSPAPHTAASSTPATGARPAPSAEPVRDPWGALPENTAEIESLISRATTRAPEDESVVDAGAIEDAFTVALAMNGIAAGWPAIIAELSSRIAAVRDRTRRCFVLFGNYHDSAGQLEAFTRLVGPRGIEPAPAIALELLAASSHHTGLDPSLASGDDEAVAAYLGGAESPSLAKAVEAGYSAWKHGYTDRVWTLLDMARAHRRTVVPCDMPRELQDYVASHVGRARLRSAGEPPVEVLRDLHCARTLADRDDPVVAAFYGAAHLASRRLPRFLPENAGIIRVHMFGHRPPLQAGVEAELNFRLTDPLLFEVDGSLVLLLDGHDLGTPTDRVRVKAVDGFQAIGDGKLMVGAERLELKNPVKLDPKSGAFLYEKGRARIAGAVTRDTATLDFSEPGMVRIEQR